MTTGSFTPRQVEPHWKELESIVPGSDISIGDSPDAIDGIVPSRVIRPTTEAQISEILKWAVTSGAKVSARGGGTKLQWGNVPVGIDLALSMEKFRGIVEHAWEDMTVTVKAGTTVAELQHNLATHGQRLALDALWPERATVGGVIATNDSGSLRFRFGSIRDLILGATVVLSNGTVARSGGKVVKNVAGYDLPKLLTGSLGTLGVITEATFRAHPLPQSTRTIRFNFKTAELANQFILAVNDSSLVPTGMQLRCDESIGPLVDVRFEGVREGIEAQVGRARELATQAAFVESSEDVWKLGENIWLEGPKAVVGKFSVLPSVIGSAANAVRKEFSSSRIIVQGTGLGLFRGECDSLEQLGSSITALNRTVHQMAGTLVWLDVPLELKRKLDVFGPSRDAYPLMVRIKQRFDPHGVLNPGRFGGGI